MCCVCVVSAGASWIVCVLVLPHQVRRASIVHRRVAFLVRLESTLSQCWIRAVRAPCSYGWCGAPTFGAAVGDIILFGWWARTPLHSKPSLQNQAIGILHGCRIPGLSSR